MPPPGTKPSTVSGRAPLRTSLKPPSPEKTITVSASASRASSVAWPARSVKTVSPAPTAAPTRSASSWVTRVAYGLTIRIVRIGQSSQQP